MQRLPPEDMEGSQPLPTNSPEGSPQQSEVQDIVTPRLERTDSLEQFRITDSREGLRLPLDSVRRIVRVNSSGDIFVESSGLPTGPFTSPEVKDHFWTTGIFKRDLFGLGAGVDITVTPESPETSDPDAIHFTTAYYFPDSDAQPVDHILIVPLQMAHYTMVPDTTNLHTENTMASQAPIGMSLSPRLTPTLSPGYHVLNASILVPTQIPSETPGLSTPSGHHFVHGFILTLPRPPSRGSLPSPIGGTNPSGTIHSFTPNYQILVGGHFHPGGQIPIGT